MESKFIQDGKTLAFPNNVRGAFIYTKKTSEEDIVEIYLTPNHLKHGTKPEDSFMKFRIDGKAFEFKTSASGESYVIRPGLAEKSSGLEADKMASYWISVDRDSSLIKYGKGYLMKETTCQIIDFNDKKKGTFRDEVVDKFFSPALPLYLMVFTSIKLAKHHEPLIDAEPPFQFKTRPLAGNLPPLVKDSSTVTLFDLDRGEFTFSDDLPTACQELYNILKGCDLEYPENPVIKLSDAMRYSINTEGKFLYKIIQSKKTEFGSDDQVYIRVTLGPDTLTGPGIPFVLEIWPSGKRSPIHNHGGACAIIKVLFGRIQISIYNKATDPPLSIADITPLMTFDAKQGEFTWIDENWYQSHELKNTTNDFCATIQSYRYQDEDKIQWPGFDYIKEDGPCDSLKTFYPNSDATFITMRKKVLEEYTNYLSGTSSEDSKGGAGAIL